MSADLQFALALLGAWTVLAVVFAGSYGLFRWLGKRRQTKCECQRVVEMAESWLTS